MSVALSVNLNKIALLRNSRPGNYPSVSEFGRLCLETGADGLTVHPRPDQRHIRPGDVDELGGLVREFAEREFNIEGNPFAPAQGGYPGLLALVERARPQQCTLVPDTASQLTSDHGFDLRADGARVQPVIEQLHGLDVRVSLFMDPDPEQIDLARAIGADRIELYTGPYAQAQLQNDPALDAIVERFRAAAVYARERGLGVNAGHDLNLANLPRFVDIPGLLEVSIGHALTVDALRRGFVKAVKAYLAICRRHPTD